MNKKLIIIIAVVLVAAIAVGLYFFVFKEDKVIREEYSPGEYFVTNVKESNRLLKATVVLVLDTDDKKVLEEFGKRNTEIRDAITTILRDQSEETLRAIDLTGLKTEILEALNTLLETEHIVAILFSDWALQ